MHPILLLAEATTWPDVAMVVVFFLGVALLLHGWPSWGCDCDCHDDEDNSDCDE